MSEALYLSNRAAAQIFADVPVAAWRDPSLRVKLQRCVSQPSQTYAVALENARELARRPMFGVEVRTTGSERIHHECLLSPTELESVREWLVLEGVAFVDAAK